MSVEVAMDNERHPTAIIYFGPLWRRWPSMPANARQARIRNRLIAIGVAPQSLVLKGSANKSPPSRFNAKFIAITCNAKAGEGFGAALHAL